LVSMTSTRNCPRLGKKTRPKGSTSKPEPSQLHIEPLFLAADGHYRGDARGFEFGTTDWVMMALAMVVLASMIGARGLGIEVLLSINRIEVGRGFEAGLSIVLLAIIIDRITHAFAARQHKESI